MTKLLLFAISLSAQDSPQTIETLVTGLGGFVVKNNNGAIEEISLARTWAGDNDVRRITAIPGLKKLDLSFTYVTDKGIELLPRLAALEELTLDTAEFISDAAMNHLRSNKRLRKLILRGTDITDVALPYIAELTALRVLDLSHTMLGDVGLESLPNLTELEILDLGATRITGINLPTLKLLPKLRVLKLKGIQRRNGGVCWTPTILDRDMDSITLLTNLEELNLGAGLGLGAALPPGGRSETNCTLTGGIRISDAGLKKLTKLRNLKSLELSGAPITANGLNALADLPRLERLSLWNCKQLDDSAALILAKLTNLQTLDLTATNLGDDALNKLAALPALRNLFLTGTNVTPAAANAFRLARPDRFVSQSKRPE